VDIVDVNELNMKTAGPGFGFPGPMPIGARPSVMPFGAGPSGMPIGAG